MDIQRTYPNFKQSVKWLGILDYKAIIFVVCYFFLIFFLLRIFIQNILIAVYITSILTIPLCVMVYSYMNQEDIFLMIKIVIKYIISRKKYRYDLRKSGIKIDI